MNGEKFPKYIYGRNENLFNSGDKRGDDGLREQLAVFLQKSRGVKADKSRIILGAGNENLLMLIKLLLPGNVIFAVENPVYKNPMTYLGILRIM